ncbi:hypothetical protein ILYODFUR_014433 [Ilyodon furcidens]|uniref:Uncharacterized protein n=1 Tax=Ilyodon furcidens TaxID=33524 RepID=A0ABV0U5D7_9TELE
MESDDVDVKGKGNFRSFLGSEHDWLLLCTAAAGGESVGTVGQILSSYACGTFCVGPFLFQDKGWAPNPIQPSS